MSETKPDLDTRRVLGGQLEDVYKLVGAVWKFVKERNAHKLDWFAISSTPGLPWNSNECQAIWRFIAYAWKPDVTTSISLDSSELDTVESDMDEPRIFRMSRARAEYCDSHPEAAAVFRKQRQVSEDEDDVQDDFDDGGEESGLGPKPAKRPRRAWTVEEDYQLLEAVEKFGEGSWSLIRKSTLTNLGATTTQLSQRYATIRKRVVKGVCEDERTKSLLTSIAQKFPLT